VYVRVRLEGINTVRKRLAGGSISLYLAYLCILASDPRYLGHIVAVICGTALVFGGMFSSLTSWVSLSLADGGREEAAIATRRAAAA
jgi:hypothetical protein